MTGSSDGFPAGFPALMQTEIAKSEVLSSGSSPVLLVLLLVLMALLGGSRGQTLLYSRLETCRHEKNGTEELNCVKKMLLQFSVINGEGKGNDTGDTIETFVTHVEEIGGETKELEVPYRITIYKSAVNGQYPVEYVQSFNAFPHEVVKSTTLCKDGDSERNPNCGWLYDKVGEGVKDSQGFCCLSSFKNKLPRWLGGTKSTRMIDTDLNSTFSSFLPWTRSGSAHCLRFSNRWYPTYRIGEPILSVSVRVVAQPIYSSTESDSHTVHVNTQQPIQINSKKTMKASLQEDFLGVKFPVLDKQFLSIPIEEGGSMKIADTNQWMLVPKTYFTLDGTECDKIGVSFSAFRFQHRSCDQAVQSCCGNQLNALAQEDSKRINDGEVPLYAMSQYGKAYVHDERNGLNYASLHLHLGQSMSSLLTLELSADNVQYADRRPGKIVIAIFRHLETWHRSIVLEAKVMNLGSTVANFTIQVSECTAGIHISSVEVTRALIPEIARPFSLDVQTMDGFQSLGSCNVILLDKAREKADSVVVTYSAPPAGFFNSKVLRIDDTNNTSNGSSSAWCLWWCSYSPPNSPPAIDTPAVLACQEAEARKKAIGQRSSVTCPPMPTACELCSWTSFSCYLWNFCWSQITKFVGILISIIVGTFATVLLFQTGILGMIWGYVKLFARSSMSVAKSVGETTQKLTPKGGKQKQKKKKNDTETDDSSGSKKSCTDDDSD